MFNLGDDVIIYNNNDKTWFISRVIQITSIAFETEHFSCKFKRKTGFMWGDKKDLVVYPYSEDTLTYLSDIALAETQHKILTEMCDVELKKIIMDTTARCGLTVPQKDVILHLNALKTMLLTKTIWKCSLK